MGDTMQAIRFHDYGGPEVMKLEQIARPVPKDDEILVRVHAMGVNPVDWKLREGRARARFNIPLPAIPGGDIAGVVEQVGAATAGFAAGQSVYAMVGLIGACAEFVALKSAFAAPKPARLDFVHAASVPLAALTAWQALFELGKLQRGQRILVQAAAGGVGGFAVQFARHIGADAVGTASAANLDYVRSLGAVDAVDYRSGKAFGADKSFDMVFDLLGGDAGMRCLPLLQSGGIFVGGVPSSEAVQQQVAALQLKAVGMQVRPDGRQLREIAALIDGGKVRTTLAATVPWQEIARAHELSKSGHTRGKIVLQAVA
jgi:NADPH:quinone reductase-like Zn-dependent oxidoreductase